MILSFVTCVSVLFNNKHILKLLYCQPINLHASILNNFIEYCLYNKAYIKKGPVWDWAEKDLIQN